MSTAQAAAESIRAALNSTSTYTPATATLLSDLLLPKSEPSTIALAPKKASSSSAASRAKSTKTPTRSRTRKTVLEEEVHGHRDQLSPKERSILATEVINAALKTLSDAGKAPAPGVVRRQASSKELVKASARKALRRSNTAPQSPLQPRSLNRVSSSPGISTRESRSSSSASITSTGHRPTAECARVAFACLRTLQASKGSGVEVPPHQLENGMSVLVGKLISLGLDDLAIKELRILKRRLDSEGNTKGHMSKLSAAAAPQTLAQLLDFGDGPFNGVKLALIITTQLQILRLISSSRRPQHAEDALPMLSLSYNSSPIKLLLLAAKEAKDSKQSNKIIRQLQTLSEILLSLAPSVLATEDTLALEPRLSVSPQIAIQLQGLALHCRFLWWGLADHKGDNSKDLHEPLLRCLSTFSRRSQCGAKQTYQIATSIFKDMGTLVLDCTSTRPKGAKSIVSGLYRLLGSLAKDADHVNEALSYTELHQSLLDPRTDSEAKQCTVIARLVSLRLRMPQRVPEDEELLLKLLEGLDRPLKGDSSEIDDLMTEVSSARKAAINLLAQSTGTSDPTELTNTRNGIKEMCETLIFLCPRLTLRYVGNCPDVKATTKDIVRQEQRRQFILNMGLRAIDSSLFLLKLLMGTGTLGWDLMDSKLQDCLALLDRLEPTSETVSMTPISSSSYHVRISNLYYNQFLNMRHSPDNIKEGQQIRALRRSVDCLRTRSQNEKDTAQYVMKLERMAEMSKANGRYDDLHKALVQIRDELVIKGVLTSIADQAARGSMKDAWEKDSETSLLARTTQSLLKLQLKGLGPSAQLTFFESSWSDEERGAILEHQLDILFCHFQDKVDISSHVADILDELLRVYGTETFPLRRFRVLLRVVSCGIDLSPERTEDIVNELDSSSSEAFSVANSRDQHLGMYLKHYKALAITEVEIRKQQPRPEIFKSCLGTWSMMRDSCPDKASFKGQVEDVAGLIGHLHIIADYFDIRGLGDTRLAALRLIADIDELCVDESDPDDIVLSFTSLGDQWLKLGYSGKAGLAFDKAIAYLPNNGLTAYAMLHLHLSHSDYLLSTGNLDAVGGNLECAQAIYKKENNQMPRPKTMSNLEYRTRGNLLASKAYLTYSKLALKRGQAPAALAHAKTCTRLIRRAWAITQHELQKEASPNSSTLVDNEKSADEMSQLSMSSNVINTSSEQLQCGSAFWAMITPLFQALHHLSNLYAHHGMFQETLYYAEQAHILAKEVGSEAMLATATALLGSIWLKAESLDKGALYLTGANKLCLPSERCLDTAVIVSQLGNMHGLLGDRDAEISAYEEAQQILDNLMRSNYVDTLDKFSKVVNQPDTLEDKMSKLTLSKRTAPPTRKATTVRPKAPFKRKPAIQAKPPIQVILSLAEQCPQLVSMKATIFREQARAFMAMKRGIEARDCLQEAEGAVMTQRETIEHALAVASHLLLQSLEQMNADPVYSVLLDSTISFPSISGQLKAEKYGDRLSVTKLSPPGKGKSTKGSRDRARSVSPAPDSFFDKLRQAQERLSEVYSPAVTYGSVTAMYRLAALLNSIAILLSAAGQVKGRSLAYPGFSSYTIETARTLARIRECKALQADPQTFGKLSDCTWPSLVSSSPRKSGNAYPCDMARFQKEYIDIIPKPWTVISISLSDSRNELSITKFQAGYSPFVLRLPLGRNNSIDADEEVFGYEQGQTELREILEAANESAHDAAGRVGREAKTAWWDERNALEARLKELLENIERVWLGGFTGMFSQHARRPELLAQFQKSFQNILDKYLPSRRKTGKRKATARVTLDSRILDLFIGLGDASDEDCDLSDPLTDLLYFVVDVLQFHGELNAYAEIDFDSIVVETHDALRSYHAAARSSDTNTESRHTILILDKALHSIPWESLPCMDGLAVSRLMSLECLKERLTNLEHTIPDNEAEGLYINRNNGTYILNPGGDLKNTQSTFEKPLRSLGPWNGIVAREPSEDEIKESLGSQDLFLYFGHGSGAQYIRTREIRKLNKCAVVSLMGCSSGSLVDTGEFEPYGPPINYMRAGCPALVATLWDVTDKDVDRFAKSTFEEWGLFETETGGRGKGKSRKAEAAGQRLSLVECVAKSRKVCRLRYLNAAAVCVYGIPVYLK